MFDKDLYDEDPFVDALFDWLEAEHATEPAIEVQLLIRIYCMEHSNV